MSQSDSHVPDDLLALHATGDPLPEPLDAHVEACPACRDELQRWRSVVVTAHATSRADLPHPPPAHVWKAIAEQAGVAAATETQPAGAPVVPLSRARRWSTSWLVAASVVGIVAGAALTAGADAFRGGDPTPPVAAPSPAAVAQTQLAALPEHQGQGAAEIVETDDGTELVVDVSGLSSGKGFYEVWLIDPDTFAMVGLGALTSDAGVFAVPDGLDLSRYRVVDVSLEPYDGDPVHSRDSVVRGELSL